MKKLLIIFLLFKTCKPELKNTVISYVGLEPTNTIIDESKPDYKLFHKTLIMFKNDSVFIRQSPVLISKNDTIYSESDGGFYYYEGQKKEFADRIEIKTIEIRCEFCPNLVEQQKDGTFHRVVREKNFMAFMSSEGLIINEIEYARTNKKLIIK